MLELSQKMADAANPSGGTTQKDIEMEIARVENGRPDGGVITPDVEKILETFAAEYTEETLKDPAKQVERTVFKMSYP